jgi:hypothetical protein
MRRYCGRRAGRYAHRVPIAARAPRLGLTHALRKRHQVSGPLVSATNTGQAGELGFDRVRRKDWVDVPIAVVVVSHDAPGRPI